jgi:hypothetical protein
MTTARLAFDRLAPAYDALASGEAFQLQRKQTHALFAMDSIRVPRARDRLRHRRRHGVPRGSAPASSRAIRRKRC